MYMPSIALAGVSASSKRTPIPSGRFRCIHGPPTRLGFLQRYRYADAYLRWRTCGPMRGLPEEACVSHSIKVTSSDGRSHV